MENFIHFQGLIKSNKETGKKETTGLGHYEKLETDRPYPAFKPIRDENGDIKKDANGKTIYDKQKPDYKTVFPLHCIRLGQGKDKKNYLIVLDFDNKSEIQKDKNGNITKEMYNGLDLYYLLKNKQLITSNMFIEKTQGGGYHVFFTVDIDTHMTLLQSTGGFYYENKFYKVDILTDNNSCIYTAPTQFKDGTGKLRKYEIIYNKLTPLPEQLKNIILDNYKNNYKHVDKKEINTNEKPTKRKRNIIIPLPELKQVLDGLSDTTADNYDEWKRIGIILNELNPDSLEIYKDFSKRSKKYKTGDCEKIFRIVGIHKLTYATLKTYLKRDNEQLYKTIFGSKMENIKDQLKQKTELIEINTKYIGQINEIVERVEQFIYTDTHKCLSIKSPMGTGKTQLIEQLLNNHIYKPLTKTTEPATTKEKFERVLYLIHRVDFSNKIYKELKHIGFKHYKDKKTRDIYSEPLLICSIDSLINLLTENEYYDLIILDEIESLLNQFSSSTITGRKINNTALLNDFLQLCKKSKKIISMDANYYDRADNFIRQITGDNKYLMIWNNYNNNEKKKLIIHGTDTEPIKMIIEHLKNYRPICTIFQSINKAKQFLNMLLNNEQLKNILTPSNHILHTAESPDKEKRKLENVNELWKDKLLVIYTPTIDVGISYDAPNHFEQLFIFCSTMSNTSRGVFQMTERIRNFKNDTTHVIMPICSFPINNQSLYSFSEMKEIINDPQLNDLFIFNEREIVNANNKLFRKSFIETATQNGYLLDNIKFLQLPKENGKTVPNKLNETHKFEMEQIKNITDNYKELNRLTPKETDDIIEIGHKIHDNIELTEQQKELWNTAVIQNNRMTLLKECEIKERVINSQADTKDKIFLNLIKYMKRLGIERLTADNVVFYKNEHLIHNLLYLNGYDRKYNSTEIKKEQERARLMKIYLDGLKFDINNDITLSDTKYKNNIKKLLNSKEYKDININTFNFLFSLPKEHKPITELKENQLDSFNKRFNRLLKFYGLELQRKRTGTHNGGNQQKTTYKLKYKQGINEIINNIIENNKYPIKKLFETGNTVLKDTLKKKQQICLFDNE